MTVNHTSMAHWCVEWKNTTQVYHSTKLNSFILIAIIIIIIYLLLFNKHRFRGDKLVVPLVPSSDKWEGFYQEGYLDLSTLAMPWEIRIQPSFLLLVFYYYYHNISVCSTIYSCVYSYYHYLIRENLRDYFLQLCHKHLHTAKWTEKNDTSIVHEIWNEVKK